MRYVLKIEGFAAYDVLEVTRRDLEQDFESAMRAALAAAAALGAEEAQDEVHRAFQFDLCPRCWRRLLEDPIAGLRQPPTQEKSQGD